MNNGTDKPPTFLFTRIPRRQRIWKEKHWKEKTSRNVVIFNGHGDLRKRRWKRKRKGKNKQKRKHLRQNGGSWRQGWNAGEVPSTESVPQAWESLSRLEDLPQRHVKFNSRGEKWVEGNKVCPSPEEARAHTRGNETHYTLLLQLNSDREDEELIDPLPVKIG